MLMPMNYWNLAIFEVGIVVEHLPTVRPKNDNSESYEEVDCFYVMLLYWFQLLICFRSLRQGTLNYHDDR